MLFLEKARGRPPCGWPGARGHHVGDPWTRHRDANRWLPIQR